MMNAAHITIVIVAWNQLDKTLDCLATVAALDTPPGQVLLVDNGSAPPLATAVATAGATASATGTSGPPASTISPTAPPATATAGAPPDVGIDRAMLFLPWAGRRATPVDATP